MQSSCLGGIIVGRTGGTIQFMASFRAGIHPWATLPVDYPLLGGLTFFFMQQALSSGRSWDRGLLLFCSLTLHLDMFSVFVSAK